MSVKPVSNRAAISCDGKDRLAQGRAVQIAQDMRRRGRKKIQAYHCVHCLAWHVGRARGEVAGRVAKSQGKRWRDVEENEERSGQHGTQAQA